MSIHYFTLLGADRMLHGFSSEKKFYSKKNAIDTAKHYRIAQINAHDERGRTVAYSTAQGCDVNDPEFGVVWDQALGTGKFKL